MSERNAPRSSETSNTDPERRAHLREAIEHAKAEHPQESIERSAAASIKNMIERAASLLRDKYASKGEIDPEARTILADIGHAVKDLPPAMGHYSKAMYVRPGAEGVKVIAEAGLISLVATNILQSAGIEITPGSVGHIATYIVAGLGVGAVNASTEANVLKWLGGKEWGPVMDNAIRAGGVALLLATPAATISVSQDTISKTLQSERAAGGVVDPLDRFASKQEQFRRNLDAFSRVPDKILEIAQKIEEGKRTEAIKKTRNGEDRVYMPWSDAEKQGFISELRTLFEAAGLDPALTQRLVFNQPKELGHGIAAKFKQALYTGDLRDLPSLSAYPADTRERLRKIAGDHKTTEEYIQAIREKMGLAGSMSLEKKMREIIKNFMTSPVFADISAHQEVALRQAHTIRAQGEDYVDTFVRSFEGVAPIDPEIMMPHVRAIIEARTEIDKAAQEKLVGPIQELFATMGEALKVAGASVDMVSPSVNLDVSDMEQLARFITELADHQAAAAPNEAAAGSIHSLMDRFVPGGKKWEHTKQWFEFQIARWRGYHVELVGSEAHMYEQVKTSTAHQERPQKTQHASEGNVFEHLLGKVREQTPDQINGMSDADLGKLALEIAAKDGKLVVENAEKRTESAAVEKPWNPDDLGKEVRLWINGEQKLEGGAPITLKPDAWNLIMHGTLPPESVHFDKNAWKELSKEHAEEILRRNEPEAIVLGGGVLSGAIAGAILGVLLGSIPAVRRLNKLLDKAAPDYEEKLLKAEIGVVKNLQRALNDTLRSLPVFDQMPPMSFSTLHAALRLAAEDSFPATLAESASLGQRSAYALKEAISPGPYAGSVEEIKSFQHFLGLLASSPKMQERFADLIAPGISEAQNRILKGAVAKAEEGDARDVFKQLAAMPADARSVFRDAARGHVRLRLGVARAEIEVLKGMRDEIKGSKEKGAAHRRKIIEDEIKWLSDFDKSHSEMLGKLDREDVYERAAATAKRSSVNPKAERDFTFVIPRADVPTKRFASSKVFAEDVRYRIDLIVRTGKNPDSAETL